MKTGIKKRSGNIQRKIVRKRRLSRAESQRSEKWLETALIYDFDGTLAHGNVQEHSFIPRVLNIDKDDFWAEVAALKKAKDADENLIYLYLMLKKAAEKNIPITRKLLAAHGEQIPLFDGVESWFDRINHFGRSCRLNLKHYIVSSGNEEIISGSKIANRFEKIFASKYLYDENGHAIWPAASINYTSKTQFLFRVNKGIPNYWDSDGVNRWMPQLERPIPFSRIIYLGDGDTDIPSMKMVRYQGGHSLAVFDKDAWETARHQEKVYNLISEDRAHYVAPGDYTEGSLLDITVKGILGRIAREEGGYRK